MAKVLYVTSNPKEVKDSISLQVSTTFIEEYKKQNPKDEIIHLDVYELNIPIIDYDVMKAWGAFQQGLGFNDLTTEQQNKIEAMNNNVDLFMEADKYVFESPLWNFTIPTMLNAYLNNVLVAGKTFKYTAEGPVGLLENKKAIHIQARGGIYSAEPMKSLEMGDAYLRNALRFIGITEYQSILIEGTNISPELATTNKEIALQQAIEVAQQF